MLYYRLYDEFGNEGDSGQAAQLSLNLGAAQTPAFGFTSREFDEIADLYFYRSRYYDPQIGRFTQRDKFNEAGFITGNPAVIYNPLQLNDYTYVGNNPLIYTDPWGYCKQGPYLIINWPINDWYKGANARYSKELNIIFIFRNTRKKHPFIQKSILAHEMFHAMEQDIDVDKYHENLDYRLEIERQAFEHEYNVLFEFMKYESNKNGNKEIWNNPELKNRLDEIRNYKNYPNPGNLYHLYSRD
jgi:RHS repeat-associated protein